VPKQGEIALRLAWAEDTVFRRLVLDVESDSCEHCGAIRATGRSPASCTSATIASTASTPWRAPSSCSVAWLTAPTAFARSLPNPQPRRRVVSHPALVDHRLGRLLLDARMGMPAGSVSV
jgi:hypothetical protein